MSTDELRNIAPILANLKQKGPGFKVPEAYFDELDREILSRMKQTQEDVPSNYFETLEDKIMQRIQEEAKPKTSKPIIRYIRISAAVAAVLLVFIFVYNPFSSSKKLNYADVEAYYEEGFLQPDVFTLSEVFNTELSEVNFESVIDTDDLDNYLQNKIPESYFYN